MRRDSNDDDPFDELFRQMERMMSEFAEEMNEAMGPKSGFDASAWGPEPSGQGGHDVHVDFHETDDGLRVVADLPGAAKEDLEVKSDGEVLSIRSTGGRRYDERVRLPVRVEETSATASYRNGVLEVTFDRADADDGGTPIDVD